MEPLPQKKIEVTYLESIVLNTLAEEMYAECGFSDVGFPEVFEKATLSMKTLKGVSGSLEKKGLIDVDRREDEGYANQSSMWIWHLSGGAEGLVEKWQDDLGFQTILIID